MEGIKDISISDKLKAIYDKYYEEEEGESEWHWLGAIDKTNNIVDLCKQVSPKTILEIGSGDGSILKRLSDLQFGDALYSIEISRTAVEIIRKREIKSLIECKLFDGYNIPYEDNKFDLAILSHVVEHLEYPRKMLYETGRVAKYIFVEVPLEDNIRLKKNFTFDNKTGHINFYSPKTIRILVQTCDLEVLSQVVTNSSYRIYEYRFCQKGVIRYLLKELMLRTMPSVATVLWTYHCSLLCRRKTE
jgi:ubiquinone/menaquinone biosynthesis C-methylase UbiE